MVSGLSDGTKDLNMNAATFAGNLTANGNIVLGNASSDTVILTGIVSLATAGSYLSNLLGTVLLPTYTFTGDVNTGMWSSGADTIDFSTAGVQRLRIGSTGLIGVGATSLDGLITLQAQAATGIQIMKSFKNSAGNTRITELFDADNVRWIVGNRSSTALITLDEVNGQLGVGLTPTNRNNCHLQTVDGIGFPATQVASSDVNTLDDYEEGSWAATVTADSGSFSNVSGTVYYTKIGRQVSLVGSIAIVDAGTASGNLKVDSIFSAASSAGIVGREQQATGYPCLGRIDTTQIYIGKFDGTTIIGSSRTVIFSTTFFV